VKDNACPLVGSATYAYNINVIPSTCIHLTAGTAATICPGVQVPLTATASAGYTNFLLDAKLEHSFNNGTEYNRNANINNNLFSQCRVSGWLYIVATGSDYG
jgi:hypothetical protein